MEGVLKENCKMKTKAKSVHVFEIRLWSKKYFIDKGTITKPKGTDYNIFAGQIIDAKTKKKIMFHRVGDLIKALERMYEQNEKD